MFNGFLLSEPTVHPTTRPKSMSINEVNDVTDLVVVFDHVFTTYLQEKSFTLFGIRNIVVFYISEANITGFSLKLYGIKSTRCPMFEIEKTIQTEPYANKSPFFTVPIPNDVNNTALVVVKSTALVIVNRVCSATNGFVIKLAPTGFKHNVLPNKNKPPFFATPIVNNTALVVVNRMCPVTNGYLTRHSPIGFKHDVLPLVNKLPSYFPVSVVDITALVVVNSFSSFGSLPALHGGSQQPQQQQEEKKPVILVEKVENQEEPIYSKSESELVILWKFSQSMRMKIAYRNRKRADRKKQNQQ